MAEIEEKITIYEGETEWSMDCPVCHRTIYASERSDGVIEIESCGCPHFKDFDWYEGVFKFQIKEH